MKIELQRMVEGIWYVYGKYDMTVKNDAKAFGEAVSELAKHFSIRTIVSYTDEERKNIELKAQVTGLNDLKENLIEECNEKDNYIDSRDETIAELEKKLEQERKLNAEIKARFVKCNTCTQEMKDKCLMFSENLCEGERCEELVDLMALVEKSEEEDKIADIKANCDLAIEGRDIEIKELEEQIEDWKSDHEYNLELMGGLNNRIAELKEQIEKMKCCENCKYNSYWGDELHCNYGLKEALQEDKLVECKNMDKWEIKEND